MIEQARLAEQAAARSDEAYETIRNMDMHNREVIVDLEAQLAARNERLEASLDNLIMFTC